MAATDKENNALDNSTVNLSTWAERNFGKPIQPIRHRTSQPKALAEKETARLKSEKMRENAKALQTEVKTLHAFLEKAINDLATKYKKKKSYISTLVHAKSTLKAKRAPNLKNALLHRKAREVNQDRPNGERLSLLEIQKMVDDDKDIENISEEQKNELIKDLKAYRELKQTGSRASSLSVAQDVRQTMQRITIEVSHLHLRTGTCSVLFVSKSHIDDQTIPGWAATGESASFFLDVLRVDVWDVLRKYEQWVCSKDQSKAKTDTFKAIRSECTTIITEGLRQILKSDNVMMNYVNYEKVIIQKHHVKLVGWPKNVKFVTPANLSSVDEVRTLRHALKSNECHWVQLSEAEVGENMASIAEREAAGEQVGRKRKQRSDKGKPKQRKKSAGSGATRLATSSKFKSKALLSDTEGEESDRGSESP
ncbi:hypothetical protein F5887DRAFT_894829 [Amanita rubescens]|nr:hypothetical protein F5887DRAFT_894805 [Amanita rubescens]KAF8331783.1 hypothetical protein F5887DRAFT_894829 [Amanita rubescens]